MIQFIDGFVPNCFLLIKKSSRHNQSRSVRLNQRLYEQTLVAASSGRPLWTDRDQVFSCCSWLAMPQSSFEVEGAGTGFFIQPTVVATAGHNFKYPAIRLAEPLRLDVLRAKHKEVAFGFDCGLLCPDLGQQRQLALPTQERIPEIGEEVAAIGYPRLPQRHPAPCYKSVLSRLYRAVTAMNSLYKRALTRTRTQWSAPGRSWRFCAWDSGRKPFRERTPRESSVRS